MTYILSESSVAVVFGDVIDLNTHRKVTALNNWLLEKPFPGFVATVPAYASLTVFFDAVLVKKHWPEVASPARAVQAFLEKLAFQVSDQQILESTSPQLVEIPVRYDGEDLPEVAERLHLAEKEVVRLHSEAIYTVFMVGFLPGFPYLGPLPEALRLPRRDTPCLRVPAGSVAIAGVQTGIYPQASPGGWHLLGHTDFHLFDPSQEPPARLQPGMQVRFIPI